MPLNTAAATSNSETGASADDISLDKDILRSQIRPRRLTARSHRGEHDQQQIADLFTHHILGIPEPEGEEQDERAFVNADVRLVPALAFDADGHRLGQGGGYYDRIIPLLSAQQLKEQSIGVVFADEIYEAIPYDQWDAILPVILTEEGVFRTSQQSPM